MLHTQALDIRSYYLGLVNEKREKHPAIPPDEDIDSQKTPASGGRSRHPPHVRAQKHDGQSKICATASCLTSELEMDSGLATVPPQLDRGRVGVFLLVVYCAKIAKPMLHIIFRSVRAGWVM